MEPAEKVKGEIAENGFSIIPDIYSNEEVNEILQSIEQADHNRETFRKSEDVFAIRQFFKEVPATIALVFNENLKTTIKQLFGDDYFVVKSIYFDKPETSNWYVPYHQDLTISVDKKVALDQFGPWTTKQNQFAVQPPIEIMENIYTIRIHLDETDENNGALRVIPKSHLKKIYRPETIDWTREKETICKVKKGGIMIMKPLILHTSGRTTNNKKRRVIHIEFTNKELPTPINWAERIT
ncbi:phytanoyl-CoA dioxygenase family protein [Pedobacter sandarakinus]|uniref:phytanoyl-CoA dioxygenase family protein n=1 Tax=Pedobacter sandarakinus TaxID=353156 RepID=UPI002247AE4D|nr:phytanoyl-CoA dioxygenase family protein [Pedobacter sandarakinus]MCX2575379.1 phytanoyl-CoA dioxygenase family protein [Pedobacter sandarakinus]